MFVAEACISELGKAAPGDLLLLALSHNSRQFVAGKSFHSIKISQPEVVIRAIRLAVQESQQ